VTGFVPKTKEKTERTADPKQPLTALAFKTVSEKHGDLVFLRIYSGELHPGDVLMNTSIKKTERISHVYRLMGDRRERLEVAGPGEIVAVVGLKQTATGHTLSAQDQPIALEEIRFPEPVIAQALTPGKHVHEAKLADRLGQMVRDD